MNARISTALAAAAFGLAALAPGIGHAATVGYHGLCDYGGGEIGSNGSSAIVAAGHTPVAVATVDAASLQSLDGLLYFNCYNVTYAANAALDAAVANGMVLVFHHGYPKSSSLPGAGGLVLTDIYDFLIDSINIDFPAGSPIANGPGGPLNNASLDGFNYFTNRGHAALSSLPAGSTVLATTPNPAQVVTFAYPYGSGRVVYGTVPIDVFLDGGPGDGAIGAPGVKAFAANLIAWALAPFTTCAAEGFTGSKLTLCRQVCEIEQTPTRLTSLIRLYMTAYRSQPPCAD